LEDASFTVSKQKWLTANGSKGKSLTSNTKEFLATVKVRQNAPIPLQIVLKNNDTSLT
jgi:hypothetical protein